MFFTTSPPLQLYQKKKKKNHNKNKNADILVALFQCSSEQKFQPKGRIATSVKGHNSSAASMLTIRRVRKARELVARKRVVTLSASESAASTEVNADLNTAPC